jgi:hypothetical protein
VLELPSSSQSEAVGHTRAVAAKPLGRCPAVFHLAPASVETSVETADALPSEVVTHVVAEPHDIGPVWPRPCGIDAFAQRRPASVEYSIDPSAFEIVQAAVVLHATDPKPDSATAFGMATDFQAIPPSVERSSTVEDPSEPLGTENVA